MTPFSKKLREIRIAKGKKQREVAEYLGIHIRSYQMYEEGKNEPSILKLIALADLFNVPLDELVGRDTQNFSQENTEG
ncbi:MAG: helix-turn-helix transcriptional regulator [Oscillospiraceae bacterium]|nr:helix-turn-helix transcriptional regulator [Oscillospiraceae bacterium]